MSWPLVALGEIFEIARGGSPRPIRDFITDDLNGVNWIMISDASESSKYISSTARRIRVEGVTKSRMVRPGDFLLTNSMSFGRPYIMRTSGCIHDGWLVLSPKSGDVSQDYFYHLLGSNTVYSEFCRLAGGTTVKNLNIDLVKVVKVPLPPLEEQRRIAAILDKADAIRGKRQRAIARMEDFLRSVFLEMFGDPITNPRGWPQQKLGDICETRLGKMLDSKKQTGLHKRAYLRNSNVQWGYFDLSDLLEMDFNEADREEFRLTEGDVLVCEGGEVGRAAIWRNELAECYFQKALHRIRPDTNRITPEYITYLMWFLSRYGGLNDHVTSATIAHLTGVKLKNILIPVPPITIQQKFQILESRFQKHKQKQYHNNDKLNDLFSSLTYYAFCGELTSHAAEETLGCAFRL